ncbi:MAG: site-specific integrase [Bacteroidota bacterium]|nr:site-specific integrase [Bacteroidota bacterium]
MATIKYIIRGKSETSSIYLRFKEGRLIDITAKTNYIINSKDWSNSKGYPHKKESKGKQLNEDLIKLSADLIKHYNNSVGKQIINTQWLKEFINPPVLVETIPTKLSSYIDYFNLHKKNAIGTSTYKRNNVYKHLIERFEKSNKTEYFIKDVHADFQLQFEDYCTKEKYSPNTIARTVKFIKTICYHAQDNGIETHFQLKKISVKLKKTEKIYLTMDELEKINNKNFEFDYLINARDWLIISCETAQRVSDFMRFNKEMIRFEGEVPLIEFTQVKTGKNMVIPLSPKVRAILRKRNGDFPRRISDQRYNEYIKEVCRIAGLTESIKGSKTVTLDKVTRKVSGVFPKHELVTSHIGHRSGATNKYGHIPTSLLKYMTGHSTESEFLKYIGKTETEKAIQLAEYFK